MTLRIPLDDLDRARRQAARKGIGCQAYIKILLREGLDRHGRTTVEVLRGTADTPMTTDEILALTRGRRNQPKPRNRRAVSSKQQDRIRPVA